MDLLNNALTWYGSTDCLFWTGSFVPTAEVIHTSTTYPLKKCEFIRHVKLITSIYRIGFFLRWPSWHSLIRWREVVTYLCLSDHLTCVEALLTHHITSPTGLWIDKCQKVFCCVGLAGNLILQWRGTHYRVHSRRSCLVALLPSRHGAPLRLHCTKLHWVGPTGVTFQFCLHVLLWRIICMWSPPVHLRTLCTSSEPD